MKIVYATDTYWPRYSGVAVSIDSFKKELEKRGHQVYILAPQYFREAPLNTPDDNNVIRFKSFKLFFSKEDRQVSVFQRRKIFKILEEIDPDIVHIQTEFSMGHYVWEYAKRRKIPIITTSHTYWKAYVKVYIPFLPSRFLNWYEKHNIHTLYELSDLLVVPTNQMKKLMRKNNITTHIEVIPTGISWNSVPDSLKADQLYEDYPHLREKRILLYVGRLGEEKNLTFLLDVFKQLRSSFSDLILLIAGAGPFEEKLAEIITQHKINDYVVLLGYVPHDELIRLYKLADVFVFASKTEAQGLVVLESMQWGLPIVAIGEMGIKDIMQGNHGGFMVHDDKKEFANAVTRLLTDQELYKRKTKEALRYAKKWSVGRCTQKMEKIYTSLIESASL